MKKIALLLSLVLCLGLLVPFAASAEEEQEIIQVEYEVLDEQPERTIGLDCYEVFQNTSAEMLSNGGKQIYNWDWTSHIGRDVTYLGCGFIDMSSDAHSGEKAIHVFPEAGQYCHVSPGGAIIPGQTYEASIWFKRLKDGGDAKIFMYFSGQYRGKTMSFSTPRIPLASTASDGWVKKTVRFVAPEYATQLGMQLRFTGPGDILWDDASLLCITNEMPKPEMADKKPALSTYPMEDASFENAKVGQFVDTVPGWGVIGAATITDKYAHTGTKSVELLNEDVTKDSIGVMYLTGIEEGATYQISTWLMNPSEIVIDMGYWVSWCSEETYTFDASKQLGSEKPRWGIPISYQWQEYRADFLVPEGAKSAQIYFRHRLTPGALYMDDVSIYMIKTPDAIRAETDETFYYTEWEKGYVNCTPNYMDNPDTMRAEFSFLGLNNEVLDSYSKTGLGQAFAYEFPLSLMAEKGGRYHVSVKVYDGNNNLVQEELFPVFRYDRPTYLGADGIFRKNGKEIPLIMGNGVNLDLLPKHPEAGGLTVIQLTSDKSGLSLSERMDKCYEQGLMVILNCYSGNKSAGHPDLIGGIEDNLAETMNHPALFGYKLCDEPYQKGIDDEEMIAGYKAIRDIDPHHPVYIDDSPAGAYEWLFRYCDIFESDYYGGGSKDSGRLQGEIMDRVQAASKGRKPYGILQQAFIASNEYVPSMDENRHLRYQAFFSGATGYSYHSMTGGDDSGKTDFKFIDSDIWAETIEKWAPWENDFAIGCFVTGEYKFVNYQKTEDVLWGTFTDGTDLYAIVLNRNWTSPTSAEIPLSDGTGELKIDAFTAKTMTGAAKSAKGNGTLSLELAAKEAVVWKITPSGAALNASHLKNSTFKDIMYYPWAYNAIATLEEKGIVNRVSNNWYGPGENITRGDYAMFLVRTLGLTGGGENFVDVDPTAEYAKELAIGKAAGIINGVGDNKFNPEAQITRQDMMTMTSRALKLAGSADLSSFSDNGLVADYAASHVSAMVADGLIRGNADGTINPLGNTTRAEAAVIMQRILNK